MNRSSTTFAISWTYSDRFRKGARPAKHHQCPSAILKGKGERLGIDADKNIGAGEKMPRAKRGDGFQVSPRFFVA